MALPPDQFRERIANSGLLSAAELGQFVDSLPVNDKPADGEQLPRLLVRARKLTAYQAQELFRGNVSGLVLGNYVILDKLGQGGMGMVLKAEHKRMHRLVALKVLSPDAVRSPEAVQRFHREVEAAARLEHANIVTAHDADESGGTHFLVMQYVEGSDLSSLVKSEGSLPVGKAVNCVLQAARGLEYAHKHGVVHRDIKPANLLLNREGVVKILDMGLARVESAVSAGQAELTGTGQIMGTIDYMAPEQALNTKYADERSDIYSLGMTLWYLLTGKAAYGGDSLMEKLLAHREQPLPSLRAERHDVPPGLDEIFQKSIAKQPGDRFQSMTEVVAALQPFLTQDSSATIMSGPVAVPEEERLSEFLRQQQPSVLGPVLRPLNGPATKLGTDQYAVTAQLSKTQFSHEATLGVTQNSAETNPGVAASSEQVGSACREEHSPARQAGPTQSKPTQAARSANKRQLLIGGAALAGIALVALGVILLLPSSYGTLSLEINDPKIEVRVDENGAKITGAGEKSIRVKAGEHGLLVKYGDVVLTTDKFELRKGQTVTLKVELLAGELQVIQGDKALGRKRIGAAIANDSDPGSPLAKRFKNLLGMEFAIIPKGKSWLGGGGGKAGTTAVEFPEDFYLGVYEVTQAEWQRVMGGNPSHFFRIGAGKDAVKDVTDENLKRFPVEMVSWEDAKEFVTRLNEQTKEVGWEYRLPTENEWEYACRGGPLKSASESAFHYYLEKPLLQLLPGYANDRRDFTFERTCQVGTYAPNSLGLYDMHGNVSEWCDDLERGSRSAQLPTHRGGGCNTTAEHCRAAFRHEITRTERNYGLGLRLARVRTSPASGPPPLAKAPFDAKQSRAHQEAWANYLGTTVETTNSVGAKMVLIPPGEFLMGSSDEQIAAAKAMAEETKFDTGNIPVERTERPQHKVNITKPFLMGATEVTIGQFKKFSATGYVTEAERAKFIKTYLKPGHLVTDESPAALISWNDAATYCQWLSTQEKATYRLPTEAEWEYACRAGTMTQFSFGDNYADLGKHAWYIDNGSLPHAVGSKLPNPFGLSDMHGNLAEWCGDFYNDNWYEMSPENDPTGPDVVYMRVFRGGACGHGFDSRSARRARREQAYYGNYIGFRVVRELDTPAKLPQTSPDADSPSGPPPAALPSLSTARTTWSSLPNLRPM